MRLILDGDLKELPQEGIHDDVLRTRDVPDAIFEHDAMPHAKRRMS